MMQGDAYNLKLNIRHVDGTAVTPDELEDVEVAFGSLIKKYSTGEVTYADGSWYFPLTQEETFNILPSKVKRQVRIVWPGHNVKGYDLGYKSVHESTSKEVL